MTLNMPTTTSDLATGFVLAVVVTILLTCAWLSTRPPKRSTASEHDGAADEAGARAMDAQAGTLGPGMPHPSALPGPRHFSRTIPNRFATEPPASALTLPDTLPGIPAAQRTATNSERREWHRDGVIELEAARQARERGRRYGIGQAWERSKQN